MNLLNSVKVQSFIRKRGFKSWLGLKPPDVMLGVVAWACIRVWDFAGARSVLRKVGLLQCDNYWVELNWVGVGLS